MNKFFKRTISIACLAALAGSMTVSASWEFAGYDTTNPPYYGKLYNEVLNGEYTTKVREEAVAPEDVEWKFEGYELAYPHTGYERLYLEGNAQNAITRINNLYPQWETRLRDFMWEVCGDHRIYQRQQTKINDAYWAWDFGNEELGVPDSYVFTPTNRYAETTDSFKATGVANLDLNGNFVYDIAYDEEGNPVIDDVYNWDLYEIYSGFKMPWPFAVELDEEGNPTKEIIDGDLLSIESLSMLDGNGDYVVTDQMIADYLDIPKTKFVTGPSYYGENPTKDVAAMYLDNIDAGWYWDADTQIVDHDAAISWTTPQHEMADPYLYYQYLIVNGLVLDGRNDTPSVRRYTGGKATPKVEWRYCFAEAAYPYQKVEVKYISNNGGEMIMAVDELGNPIVRIPTGEYANAYFVVTDTDVEVWIRDDVKSYLIESFPRAAGPFGGSTYGYTSGAAYIL